jgi:low affinity Fe/Cu permease
MLFAHFANLTAEFSGHPIAFLIALSAIVIWLATGPIFHYSDTWQLVINTATTIITFLMVFLIQNAQNRSSYATQIKLDEIIRAIEGAHNALLDLEELTDEEIGHLRKRYAKLAMAAREELRTGHPDTGRPDFDAD